MFKFFRHIRKSLILENKTSKYLKYAIGEIVLVVLGILIALQINNWNEERKTKQLELGLLKELLNVLESGGSIATSGELDLQNELDFQLLQLNKNKQSKKSGELLLSLLENDLPYHDSLKVHFSMMHTLYTANIKAHAYEKAKDHGLDFIENDSLKTLLYWTYETNTFWLEELNNRNNFYENNVVHPKLIELFASINTADVAAEKEMIPLNFEVLKTDNAYLNILRSTIIKRDEYIRFQEKRYNRLLNIAKLLKNEITLYENQP